MKKRGRSRRVFRRKGRHVGGGIWDTVTSTLKNAWNNAKFVVTGIPPAANEAAAAPPSGQSGIQSTGPPVSTNSVQQEATPRQSAKAPSPPPAAASPRKSGPLAPPRESNQGVLAPTNKTDPNANIAAEGGGRKRRRSRGKTRKWKKRK